MPDLSKLRELTGDQIVALLTLIFSFGSLIYAAIPVHAAFRARRLKVAMQRPGVKATINRTPSVDGWRSIQIHLTAPQENAQAFDFRGSGWRIRSATLKWPRDPELAFARADDHSLRGPIVASSGRTMSGRLDGPQPFAMEFFIRFRSTPLADQGMKAKFGVKVWRKQPYDPGMTFTVWAEVPLDAEREPRT